MSARRPAKSAAHATSGLGFGLALFGGLAAVVVLAAALVAHAVLNLTLTA